MLIALVGFIGSGKDTVGRHLVETHDYQEMAFADALKDVVSAMFGWDRDLLEGKSPESRAWRTQVDTWWAERLGIPNFTPRWALQNIGTETIRQYFDDNLWILNVERRIAAIQATKPSANIVITDGRFPNELNLAREQKGFVVRVKRGPEPEWYETALLANSYDPDASLACLTMETKYPDVHISEWAWVGYTFDAVIENDAGLDSLFAKATNTVHGFASGETR